MVDRLISIDTTTGRIAPLAQTEIERLAAALDTVLDSTLRADFGSALGARELSANKGQPNGYAPLNGAGQIAATYLPSYVDDIVEVANYAALPASGDAQKVYLTLNDLRLYRWGGSAYAEVSASPGSTDAVPEGAANLYFTSARADARVSTALAGRTIGTGAGLTGGGDLSQNRTIAISFGTAAGTVAAGNDSRFSDTRVPTDASVTVAKLDPAVVARLLGPVSTRSAAYCFAMCQSTATYAANTGFHNRRPFKLGVKPTRFRVRVKNRVQLGGSDIAGSIGQIQNLTIVIGKPAADATTGDSNGNWLAAPTPVMSSTTIAAGVEAVSPWIDAATYSVDVDVLHMLGLSFLSANVASGQVALSGGFSFQNQTPSDLTVLAPSTALARADNAAFLQIIIEYEHVDRDARHLLIVGNSLSLPSATTGVTNIGELGSFGDMWQNSNHCAASNITVAGSYSAHFTATMDAGNRWNQFDGFNIPYVPDMILYWAASSSDIADTTTASGATDVQNNVRAMVRKGRAKFASCLRHVLTNVPPRINFTGLSTTSTTNEYARVNHNNWLNNNVPVQVERTLDIDSLATDWADPARIRAQLTTDGVHHRVRLHDTYAGIIPLKRGS